FSLDAALFRVAFHRVSVFFFQAEDGIRDFHVTGVQTCALPISLERVSEGPRDVAGQVVRQQGRSRNKPQTGARDARQGQQEATGCLVLSDAEVVHSGASRKWTLGRS